MSRQLILNHTEISLKLDRIAWQILEEHYKEDEIVLIGIQDRGAMIAQMLTDRLRKFGNTTIHSHTVSIDKDAPLTTKIEFSDSSAIANRAVVIVDDVLNSGITLAAAVREVLGFNPKQLKVAVLANRDHHKFPVQVDYVGISMATTLMQHIAFVQDNDALSVYLD